MNLEDLLFPVKIVPSVTFLEGYDFVNKHEGMVIVEPVGEKPKVVNVPSLGYGLLPLADILIPLEEKLRESFTITPTYSHRDHARFSITYVIEGVEVLVGKKDKLNPFIKIIHSYDSSTIFQVKLGFSRQLTKTGIMGATFQDVITSHTVDMIDEVIEDTINAVTEFIENCEDYKVEAYDLINKKVTNVETRVDQILEETGEMRGYKDLIMQRIAFEIAENKLPQTDWLIYNAINYQLNFSSEAQENMKMKKDQKIYSYIASSYAAKIA